RQKRRHPRRNLRRTRPRLQIPRRQLRLHQVPPQIRGCVTRHLSPCAKIFISGLHVIRNKPMKITHEDVLRVADLAYLELSESELETYRAQIDEILEYIGKLNELSTANVAPMTQVLSDDQTADATLREDIHVRSTVAADVLKHAPDPEPPFFRVPKVIER